MATFLFNEIIFGPVKSRRLGVSLSDLPSRTMVAEKLDIPADVYA